MLSLEPSVSFLNFLNDGLFKTNGMAKPETDKTKDRFVINPSHL
jgi:hypothetical protein